MKIIIADDHTLIREGLKAVLAKNREFEIIAQVANGRDALEKTDILKPDLLLLDISMPLMDGIEVARQVRRYHAKIWIIMLSQSSDPEQIRELLQIGVNGYLLKDSANEVLLQAINEVKKGRIFLSPELPSYLTTAMNSVEMERPAIYTVLTNREREVLKLLAEQKSNREIGNMLFISVDTVKTHRRHVMKKLKLKNFAQLLHFALKHNIVEK